jgi:hypothetical protein
MYLDLAHPQYTATHSGEGAVAQFWAFTVYRKYYTTQWQPCPLRNYAASTFISEKKCNLFLSTKYVVALQLYILLTNNYIRQTKLSFCNKTDCYILDFRFSPCSESFMFFFGHFPSIRLSFADVSEPSVMSIFKGWMKNILPKRRQNLIWRRGNTQKKTYTTVTCFGFLARHYQVVQ